MLTKVQCLIELMSNLCLSWKNILDNKLNNIGRFEKSCKFIIFSKTYLCLPNVGGFPNVLGNDGLNIGAGDDAGLEIELIKLKFVSIVFVTA